MNHLIPRDRKPGTSWTAGKHLVLLMGLGAGVRLGAWTWTRSIAPWGDEHAQLSHAWDLVVNGQQHVFWPPMSIWISGALFRLLGEFDFATVRLLWVLLDVLNILMIYTLATSLFDRSTAFWASLLYALYPLAVSRAVYVTSEIPSMLFGLAAITCLTRFWVRGRTPWAVATGALLGCATLARGMMISILFLLPLAALASGLGGSGKRQRARAAAVILIAGLVVWFPWVMRNRVLGGQWVLVSTNASYNLRMSADSETVYARDSLFLFHPWATRKQREHRRDLFDGESPRRIDRNGVIDDVPAFLTVRLSPEEEFERNAADQRAARQGIGRNPLRFAVGVVGRFARFWALDTAVRNLLGRERWGKVFGGPVLGLIAASNLFYVFAALGGVLGWLVLDQWRVKLLVAVYVGGPLLACALVHAKPRYHLPAVPLLFVLAVWAVSHVRTWKPHLTTRQVVAVGVCWCFFAWTWIAWVIFAITSRANGG